MPTTEKKTIRKPAVKKTTVRKTAAHPRVAKKEVVLEHVAPRQPKSHKHSYIFAVGRRKEAVARVRWEPQEEAKITVNGREFAHYFPSQELQFVVKQPLVLTQNDRVGSVSAKVSGGGISGQAESVRLGIARALVKQDADLRLVLKKAGFLRRDPRAKERKKYGLKRARRAPQWQKR